MIRLDHQRITPAQVHSDIRRHVTKIRSQPDSHAFHFEDKADWISSIVRNREGCNRDVANLEAFSRAKTLQAIKVRWERVNAAVERIVGSETTLVAVAKGNEAVGESSRGLGELAQQAGQQLLQAGGSPRDVELTTQLAGLTQRGSSPAACIRRSVSRQERPASTRIFVPELEMTVLFAFEPLASTVMRTMLPLRIARTIVD